MQIDSMSLLEGVLYEGVRICHWRSRLHAQS